MSKDDIDSPPRGLDSNDGSGSPKPRIDPHTPRHFPGPPDGDGSELEPDNYVLECKGSGITSPWEVVAAIAVDTVNESWTIAPKGAASLQSASEVRFRATATSIDGLRATSKTVVTTWAAATNPTFPKTGRTFAGEYVLAGNTLKLAINFNFVTVPGGAAIKEETWYKSDLTSDSVKVRAAGGAITMTVVTGTYYVGDCVVALVEKTYNPALP